jgi:hypothetical protein
MKRKTTIPSTPAGGDEFNASSQTRIFSSRAEVVGEFPVQGETVVMPPGQLTAPRQPARPFDARDTFLKRYPAIQKALKQHRHTGLLLLAFGASTEPLAQAWYKLSSDKMGAIVVGRHQKCAFALPEEQSEISLRHLVVLTRALPHDAVRLRLLDLHTSLGFIDEQGRHLRAATSDGTLFIRLGDVTLMLIVTNAEDPVLDFAAEAYARVPERRFFEEQEGAAYDTAPRYVGTSRRQVLRATTSVFAQAGPVAAAAELCDPDEEVLGTLEVAAAGGVAKRAVGARALARGILVGRYARCEVGASAIDHSHLSRVHMLIIRVGGELLAVDVASSNGTLLNGKPIEVAPLRDGDQFNLGDELYVGWRVVR